MMWDRVSRTIRKKIQTFDESGMGYWLVRATLSDGRVFDNVYINDFFQRSSRKDEAPSSSPLLRAFESSRFRPMPCVRVYESRQFALTPPSRGRHRCLISLGIRLLDQ